MLHTKNNFFLFFLKICFFFYQYCTDFIWLLLLGEFPLWQANPLLCPVSRIVCDDDTRSTRLAPQQLDWQAQELAVLIHFNIATYVDNHDGCSGHMVPPIAHFDPDRLSTDNWIQTAVDFGAQHAVLVAKHACGFLLSPTNVTFPLNPSGELYGGLFTSQRGEHCRWIY
jgi:hypothetical protein